MLMCVGVGVGVGGCLCFCFCSCFRSYSILRLISTDNYAFVSSYELLHNLGISLEIDGTEVGGGGGGGV